MKMADLKTRMNAFNYGDGFLCEHCIHCNVENEDRHYHCTFLDGEVSPDGVCDYYYSFAEYQSRIIRAATRRTDKPKPPKPKGAYEFEYPNEYGHKTKITVFPEVPLGAVFERTE